MDPRSRDRGSWLSPESLLSTPSRLLRAVLLDLFVEVTKVVFLAFLPVPLEIPEAPAIAHDENPDWDSALVQTAAIRKLVERITIWVLATPAVVLPPIHHLTGDSLVAFCNALPIDIVSEKPADNVVELQLIFPWHLWPPVMVV